MIAISLRLRNAANFNLVLIFVIAAKWHNPPKQKFNVLRNFDNFYY